ncbi:hypothetical protein ACTFIY_007430 [Dictyostelium cf. discoideum]
MKIIIILATIGVRSKTGVSSFGFATATFPFYWYEIDNYSFGPNGYLCTDTRSLFKHIISVVRACLAFDVLAWVFYLVGIVLLIVQLTGKFKDSSALKIAIPGARKKDCIPILGEVICEKSDFDLISSGTGYTQNPGISWIFVIISAAFSIAPMILNFCGAF